LLSAPDILAAMKPTMKQRKILAKIVIVGAGRLGTTLAERLAESGYAISEIVTRNDLRSLANARRLARKVAATARISRHAKLDADVVWFCVPDSQIAAAAADLSGHGWKNKVALHSSGVLSSDVLAILREQGASVASLHPLMTFVQKSKPNLQGVPFAVEGDAVAVGVANSMISNLGGNAFRIRKQNKIAYHAFATMICPLLISLLAASEKVASLAGISPLMARRRMQPILRQTLANYENLGAPAAFSGPIVRGDAETIARHLAALQTTREAHRVYMALAEAASTYLPSRNRTKIRALLNRSQTTRHNG
jgi:predicted short-subunit dehydrogenase-like oxidoreductase (DUF2520 family)